MIDFDLVLDYLGHYGKFQCCVMILTGIAQLFGGMQMHVSIFHDVHSNFNAARCRVPYCDNATTDYQENFVKFSIPQVVDEYGQSFPDSCKRFATVPGFEFCGESAFDKNKTQDCSSYVWDRSEFEETVVSEFDIVCKRSSKSVSSSMLFMSGVLFGSAAFGMFSDKFGRKNVMMSASLLMLASSIGASFAPNMPVFSFLRFITAFSVSGLFQTGYILAVEYIGTSKRLICANMMQIVFAVGELVLGLVAYLIRRWRVLELAISIPASIMLIYYWLLPESVRWLISKGKHNKAKQTILRAARWNNVVIPENLLRAPVYSNTNPETEDIQQSSSPMSLVRTPRLRKWTLNIFFCWIVNAMVYYGLSLSAKNLGGNVYQNFALLSFVEIPAILLATWALSRFGRRTILCAVMVLGGAACLSTVFVPASLAWVSTVLAIFGKSAISASFAIIYIYSAEIYPTTVRSTGIGLSSMFGRVGGILAPFIAEMRKVYKPLPMILFGAASIASGVLALALPETHNQQLPETIEEAESFGLSQGYERLLSRPRDLPVIGSGSSSVIGAERATRRITEEVRRLIDT